MSFPGVYLLFPGTAREALEFYRSTFGGDLESYDYSAFGRTDGPGDAIAHAELTGPVKLSAADAGADDDALAMTGMMLSLLGAAAPSVLHEWFDALADGGRVIDPLSPRPWGDTDGRVTDRYGVSWLVGYKGGDARG